MLKPRLRVPNKMKSVILRSPRRADDEESGEGRKSPLPQTILLLRKDQSDRLGILLAVLGELTRNRRRGSFWGEGRPRNSLAGEAGFTLPFVIVMIGLSLTIIAAVTLLDSHFRSIAKAGDGERMYYALDSALELSLIHI